MQTLVTTVKVASLLAIVVLPFICLGLNPSADNWREAALHETDPVLHLVFVLNR